MADDLVISLSAETQDFLRDMKASSEQMKRLGDQGQKTNSLLSGLKWSFAANSFGVMVQDMTTVASMGGNVNQILNAGANNAIQLATQLHPAAGAITAAGIAGYQLYTVLSGSAAEAKKIKDNAEQFSKGIGDFGKSGVVNTQAEEGRKLQREIGTLQNQIDAVDQAYSALQTKKNDAISKNTNALGFQMDDKTAKANIAQLQAQQDELLKEREKFNTSLQAKEAVMEVIGPEARKAIAAEAQEKAKKDREAANKKDLEDRREIANVVREAQRETEAANKKRIDQEYELMTILEQERNLQYEMDKQKRDAAKSLTASVANPFDKLKHQGEQYKKQAGDYLKPEDMSKLLMRDAAQAFASGPQLSAGLVKGTIEEESFRNRQEAARRQEQFAKTMVDRIVNAIKGIDRSKAYDTVGSY